jgi:hypothetical protein
VYSDGTPVAGAAALAAAPAMQPTVHASALRVAI